MLILGIHDGHNATAAVLKDGKIIAAISEERLARRKNEPGYPVRAINKVLEITGFTPVDIDYVALASEFLHPKEFYMDWDWFKRGYEEELYEKIDTETFEQYKKRRLKERKETIKKHLGIAEDIIVVVEHHLAHASAAYFGYGKKEPLVLTLDGSGDGICATVNRGLNRIAETPNTASIGKIYSRVTYLLGMKPREHEYKLMGLAPYASKKGVRMAYHIIKKLIRIDNGSLVFKNNGLSTNFCYQYLRKYLENHRFDYIAGAVQKLTEDVVLEWAKNAMKYTGEREIICGGGVFMNVKLNMLLCDIVDNLFIFPSCGDESLAIGAAYYVYYKHENKMPEPFHNIYLGPEYTQEEVSSFSEQLKNCNVYKSTNITKEIAGLLSDGEIVARFNGRMEWGARALGNRSILANPADLNKVKELNIMIKARDFWMPFAPTILYERQHDYILNEKEIESPYMMIAFRTTKRARKELAAAVHPYDYTARPQILKRKSNPDYYDLIKEFEKITGIGAVLNTSFNLHGEPIVCSLEDAFYTFMRSGLRFLAIGNYLIEKTKTEK